MALYESSPVYRVLFNEDLFENVVRLLLGLGKGRNHGSVASLACASREFMHTALRVLWERMWSLVPLLKTVPGLVWKSSPINSGDGVQWHVVVPQDDPTMLALDTAAFRRYSAYIKCFAWLTNDEITPGTFKFFGLALSSVRPWFPSIRSLVWFERRMVVTLPPVWVFGVPSLEGFFITASRYEKWTLINILKGLPERCPGLQHLSIQNPVHPEDTRLEESSDFAAAFTGFLHKCIEISSGAPNLRTLLSCVPIQWEDIMTLAQMPRLEELAIHVSKEEPKDFEALPVFAFQGLLVLKLCLETLGGHGVVVRLLDGIGSLRLKDIDVSIAHVAPRERMVHQLFETLSRSAYRQAVERLVYKAAAHQTDDSSQVLSVSMCTLQPLLQLSNLASLSVTVPNLYLEMDDFCTLSKAWPHLTAIDLQQTAGITYIFPVDWLAPFALYSLKLKTITGIDVMEAIPGESLAAFTDAPNPATPVEAVACGVYEDKQSVRDYLGHLFPKAVLHIKNASS
ncbi:uncharacterized protein C8Q71DRAFT_129940 [Rhodofomes roseus]|uniref:F-box domain-containing protein n=1 Tax=Rhodofomes roseus TaxID=34475 RepID=A0ABQ8KC47_9APHY|nr:uncharacterized protein C8Q71DRAFT_129940 [Rhodofomes roseus]KAH9834884.1 hypothetical protein C8Q71DRAFT_129940 [Rhodofomes roseus]